MMMNIFSLLHRPLRWLAFGLSLLLALSALPLAQAQQPTFLKDINTTPVTTGSKPANFVQIGTTMYFSATTPEAGTELWKTDGTLAGTMMVKDIVPGSGSGYYPSSTVNFNGTLYFNGDDGNGPELWKSDGTEAGTVMVQDINTVGASTITYMTVVGSTLFFVASDGSTGFELFKSDGTTGGTMLVKDIVLGAGGSDPAFLTNVNGTLFFTVNDGVNGEELWKSNGTDAGTVMVKNIRAGSASSQPRSLINFSNTLFFTADDGVNGTELWKSDGTDANTEIVKNIDGGSGASNPDNLFFYNGALYFSVSITSGNELWKSNGTVLGTTLVKNTAPVTWVTPPSNFTVVGSTLFFSASDGTNGTDLWKSDGTPSGTEMVIDISPATEGSEVSDLEEVAGTLYFRASDGTGGMFGTTNYALWKSDGTTLGTSLVKDIYPGTDPGFMDLNYNDFQGGLSNLTNFNGSLLFAATDGVKGMELWKSNGTDAGTVLLKDLYAGSEGSNADNFVDVNGTIFFKAVAGGYSFELWKSDGTVAGTVRVKDINPTGNDDVSDIIKVGSVVYFRASDGSNGPELWKSDGTAAGTVMVKDIAPGSDGGFPQVLTNVNGTLFFMASDGVTGQELWKSNGTEAGTVLIKDIRVGANSAFPTELVNVNGILYFTADDGINGTELWKSNGTDAGTVMVADINPGPDGSGAQYLTNVNGTVFFRVLVPPTTPTSVGLELWKSDGTSVGTVMVKDINPGTGGSSLQAFTVIGSTLYFQADNGTNGQELWKSDGTDAGTTMVKDINPGNGSGAGSWPVNLNGTLYFSANDGVNGTEVWKSDGTDAGTTVVKDIYPGSSGSQPSYFVAFNNKMYFAATDNVGENLWVSDGTSVGTISLPAATTISNIQNIAAAGSLLFFTASNADGQELWKYNETPTYITIANGNWTVGTTWEGGLIPAGNGDVTIAHVVDLNTSYSTGAHTLTIQNTKSLNIKNGQMLTIATGGTVVNTGILISNVGGNLVNNGTLTNNGILQCKEGFTNNATLTNGGILNNIKTLTNSVSATIANTGTINNQLTFNNPGALVNQGIVNNNAGILTNNGSFTNSIGIFNNNSGATLGGAGAYTGTLNNDGTFSPGNSPGVFTINGDFVNNGILRIELGGNGGAGLVNGHDKLVINGNVTLNGGVEVVLYNGFTPTGTVSYEVVNATGTVTQSLGAPTFPAHPGTWGLTFGANTATVTYTASPFPVEWLSFEATPAADAVVLDWTTGSEQNTASFTAERSLTGVEFAAIGMVPAAGNSSSPTAYTYTDAALPADALTLHYRIRQVDTDGSASHSEVRTVMIDRVTGLMVYPNPVTHQCWVRVPAGVYEVIIRDEAGRAIRTTKLNGEPATLALDLGDFASGVYTVQAGTAMLKVVKE